MSRTRSPHGPAAGFIVSLGLLTAGFLAGAVTAVNLFC